MLISVKNNGRYGEKNFSLNITWYDILLSGLFGALITGIVLYFAMGTGRKD